MPWKILLAGLILMAGTHSQPCRADGNNYGAAPYLQQGVGSRAAGMGDAFVALADDATAGYWNPAGLSQMGLYRYQAGAQYAFLPNGMSHNYLSYAFLLPETGAFAISWINFTVLDLEKRDAAGNPAGMFGSTENTFIFSYGRRVYEWVRGLSVGANLKVLQQGIDTYSAWGHGLDLALLWQPVLSWEHTLGVNVQNLFQRVYWNTAYRSVDASLINVKAGAALKFLPSEEELYYNHLIIALDFDVTEYSRFRAHAGAEYWFLRDVAARAGFDGEAVTAGASYRPRDWELDYAFYYDLSELGAHQHRLSLLLRFK